MVYVLTLVWLTLLQHILMLIVLAVMTPDVLPLVIVSSSVIL
jgi:hypothetical protein